uniref:Uncharacterized protein n=1 Tax=Oryza punctata TaxID=4537 RepID=A0A0E0LVX7_ORYPU
MASEQGHNNHCNWADDSRSTSPVTWGTWWCIPPFAFPHRPGEKGGKGGARFIEQVVLRSSPLPVSRAPPLVASLVPVDQGIVLRTAYLEKMIGWKNLMSKVGMTTLVIV